MSQFSSHDQTDAAEAFLAVAAERQTYRNLGYLLLALPLGIAYLGFIVVGFLLVPGALTSVSGYLFDEHPALGMVAIPVAAALALAGLPIPLALLGATRALAAFEARLATVLLGKPVTPQFTPLDRDHTGRWTRLRERAVDLDTLRGLAFLVVKLPLGILSLAVVSISFLLPASLLGAPVFYRMEGFGLFLDAIQVDSLSKALICVAVAPVAALVSLHLVNGAAWLSAELAGGLLNPQPIARRTWTGVRG